MPRKDSVHDLVRLCLEADGWEITNDPYYVKALGADYDVDLGAEKLMAAEKGVSKIAVEVKSFSKPSFSNEFHSVLGQYTQRIVDLGLRNPLIINIFRNPQSQIRNPQSQIRNPLCIFKLRHLNVSPRT
jgi:XisH protein